MTEDRRQETQENGHRSPVTGHLSPDLSQLDSQAKEIVARYDQKRAATLTLLHLAQDKVGFISPEVEAWVSKWTEVPAVHIHEVVTFYTMFHQKPVGKHHIRFCTTTACVLMGSEPLLEHLRKKVASTNGKVTLEEAECLCACEIAPMMQVNGDYHGPLTVEKIDRIIDELK